MFGGRDAFGPRRRTLSSDALLPRQGACRGSNKLVGTQPPVRRGSIADNRVWRDQFYAQPATSVARDLSRATDCLWGRERRDIGEVAAGENTKAGQSPRERSRVSLCG